MKESVSGVSDDHDGDDGVHGGVGGDEMNVDQDNTNTNTNPSDLRILVSNLPKYWNQKAFIKFLSTYNITSSQYTKAKKIPQKPIAFLSFSDKEGMESVCVVLEKAEVKGKGVRVERNPPPPTQGVKRKYVCCVVLCVCCVCVFHVLCFV